MLSLPDIHITDFDYPLTDEKIAKYPLIQREQSKLLVYKNQSIYESRFYNLPEEIPKESLLIFNNTKVIHARLHFKKVTGAIIEIFCLEPYQPSDYYQIFDTNKNCSWKCLVGNKRKWKSGKLETKIQFDNKTITLSAEIKKFVNELFIIEFSWDGPVSFGEILDQSGNIPIPPYLHRNSEKIDFTRYQTVYSRIKGSVAAPTAGLHFTPKILDELKHKNILQKSITLHVGAGTFQPVKATNMTDHRMHTEYFSVHVDTLEALAKAKRVIAVGTTSLRTIESIYHLACKIIKNKSIIENRIMLGQWEAYDQVPGISPGMVLEELVTMMHEKGMSELHASTQIMIVPGYKFTLTDGLVTNFHLPKSTLLLLIAAFIGNSWKDVYNYALNNNFRFLSYGDGSILLP